MVLNRIGHWTLDGFSQEISFIFYLNPMLSIIYFYCYALIDYLHKETPFTVFKT
jgi:hypothetical protein